jgi:hypothetical protein
VFGPDSSERSEAAGSLDVADEADDDHLVEKVSPRTKPDDSRLYVGGRGTYRRSLNNGDSLDNLFLVHLRTRSIKVADDGGHPGLVSHGGGQMDWFLGVILWKAGNVSASTLYKS